MVDSSCQEWPSEEKPKGQCVTQRPAWDEEVIKRECGTQIMFYLYLNCNKEIGHEAKVIES